MEKRVTRGFKAAVLIGAVSGAVSGAMSGLSGTAIADQGPGQGAPLQWAQAEDEQRDYDIASQPLSSALALFGQQSGLQVTVDGALVRALSTPGVRGRMTAPQALQALLAGSGLGFSRAGATTLVIEPREEGSGPLRLAPLTVTGERVERTVFETPASVAVVTGAQIEATPRLNDVEDVLDLMPNILQAGTSNNGPSIRGVDTTGVLEGGNSFLGGARPRATITIDGRPLTFNEFIYGETSVWDLERVEVFRGPQTSAQGVNSIAGAIYVQTADPTFTPEAKAQAEIGSDRRRRVSAAASGPILDDQLAGRIAVDYQSRESFVGFDPTVDFGPDPNDFENLVVRGKLLWEPDAIPGLSTQLTFSRTESEAPQGEQVRPPFEDFEPRFDDISTWRTSAYSGIHDLRYAVSDTVEISNRFVLSDVTADRFAADPTNGAAVFEALDLVNETTVTWRMPQHGLSGLGGGYLQRNRSEQGLDLSAFLGLGQFDDTQLSIGLFGELTYEVTDRLDVTAGLRYQRDSQDRDGFFGPFTINYDETFDAFLPKVALGYDLTEDVRIGAIASRGFNPGGLTISFNTGAQDTFDQETVWNFELFGRASLLDDRLAITANAFHARFSDFQRFTFTGFDPRGNPEFQIDNADRAVSYGLELGADFQATERLRVFGGLGLLETELKEFSASADPNVEGTEFADAPNVNLTVGASYEIIDNLVIGGQVRYVGEYFSDADNTPEFKVGDYAVADFEASYTYENVEIYAFVNNAFDEFYTITDFGPGGFVGTPRQAGAGLRLRF